MTKGKINLKLMSGVLFFVFGGIVLSIGLINATQGLGGNLLNSLIIGLLSIVSGYLVIWVELPVCSKNLSKKFATPSPKRHKS